MCMEGRTHALLLYAPRGDRPRPVDVCVHGYPAGIDQQLVDQNGRRSGKLAEKTPESAFDGITLRRAHREVLADPEIWHRARKRLLGMRCCVAKGNDGGRGVGVSAEREHAERVP